MALQAAKAEILQRVKLPEQLMLWRRNAKRRNQQKSLHQAARENDAASLERTIQELKTEFHETVSLSSATSRKTSHLTFLSEVDEENYTPMHYAARYGCDDAMAVLLRENADPLARGDEGVTPLHLAAKHNSKRIIEIMMPYIFSTSSKRSIGKGGIEEGFLDDFLVTPLHNAAARGHGECVEILLRIDSNPDPRDATMVTPLHLACSNGRTAVVQQLLDNNANIQSADSNGTTPLQYACNEGYVDIVKLLLARANSSGIKARTILEQRDNDGNLAIHLAVQNGHVDVVSELIAYGANPNAQTNARYSCLHIAARNGHLEVARLLVAKGANKLERDRHGLLPLHRAAQFGRAEIVDFLIAETVDRDASLEVMSSNGFTPLLFACWQGHANAARLLLERKAHIAVTCKLGKTPLHWAITNDHLSIVELLLSRSDFRVSKETIKELLDHRDKYDRTPLHLVAKSGNTKIARLLLEEGADTDARDDSEQTPLHYASKYGRKGVAKLLLAHDPMLAKDDDDKGQTSLHMAAARGFSAIMEILIAASAAVDSFDDFHQTPLDIAASAGHLGAVQLLVEKGCFIDPTDKNGVTPLMQAARNGKYEIVRFLLDRHANIAHQNNVGLTALDIAAIENHAETAKTILAHPDWRLIFACKVTEEHTDVVKEIGMTPMKRLVLHMPKVATIVLNKCMRTNNKQREAADYEITYDFSLVDDDPKSSQGVSALGLMAHLRRGELLNHAVVDRLLNHKWDIFGAWIFRLQLFFWISFVFFVTVFVVDNRVETSLEPDHTLSHLSQVAQYWCVVFVLCGMFIELFQLYQLGWAYFELSNFLDWGLFISTLIFFLPFESERTERQWNAGAVTVFLAWMNLMVFFRQLSMLGIYVLMLTDTLMTVIKVMSVFSLFVFAFGMSFYIMLQSQENFASIPRALAKVMVMMTGEYEYDDIITNNCLAGPPDNEALTCNIDFEAGLYIMLIFFVLAMNIVLMNLLIGLAVGDIESVSSNARVARQSMVADFLLGMERILPQWLRRYCYQKTIVDRPNQKTGSPLRALAAYIFGSEDSAQQETSPVEELREDTRRMRKETRALRQDLKGLKRTAKNQTLILRSLAEDLGISLHIDSNTEELMS